MTDSAKLGVVTLFSVLACGAPGTCARSQGVGSDHAYFPNNPPKVSVESDAWRVTSVWSKTCHCGASGVRLAINATSKLSGARKQFVASSFISQANKAVLVGNHLVVTGFINGDLDDITIVDLLGEKTIEDIWCYSPTVSPDHRYIAYVRFFPTHPGPYPGFTSDVYLIYDLAASPNANRVPPPWPSPINDHIYVGVPVYPIANARAFSYYLDPVSNWIERHDLTSRFAWRSPIDLTFTDKHLGDSYRVEIGLRHGAYHPTIRALRITK